MEGFKVRCRTCGTILYETTRSYNCHKPLTGDMLRLLPFYKYWPTYDGSLAVESTSRFLMFCSNCAGYISTTGNLEFADFPDEKVHTISEERSMIGWLPSSCHDAALDRVDSIKFINDIRAKSEAETEACTPEDVVKKLEKRANISRKKKGKKRK